MELSELSELLEEDNWEEINSELDSILEEAIPAVLDLLSQHVRYAETLEDLIYHYQERRIRSEQNFKAIRSSARYVLTHLAQSAAHDYLCQQFINDPDEEILELCHTGGYLPNRADQQALFFVLSRQWQRYDELTRGDHALLKQALQKADGTLLRKVAQATRESGRPEIWRAVLPSVTPDCPDDLPRPLDSELLYLLVEEGRYAELWELALQTSPYWSYRILTQLDSHNWKPDQPKEKAVFESLLNLAQAFDYKVEEEVLETVEITTSFSIGPFGITLPVSPNSVEWWYLKRRVQIGPNVQTLTRLFLNETNKALYLEIWEISSQQLIALVDVSVSLPSGLSLSLSKPPVLTDFTYSNDGKLLACVGTLELADPKPETFSTGLWLYDIAKRQFVGSYLLEAERALEIVKFSPDDQKLLLTSSQFALYEFALDSLEFTRISQSEITHSPIDDFTFSSDNHFLAISHYRANVILLKLPELEKVQELGDAGVNIKFSPDGQILAFSEPYQALQWLTLSVPTAVYTAEWPLSSLDFSKDSRFLIGSTIDGMIVVWDIAEKNPYEFPTGGYTERILTIAISSDGQSLISVTEQGLVRTQSLQLFWLYHLPIKQSKLEDFLWLQARAADPERGEDERAICEFAAAQYALKWRYDVEVELTSTPPMAYDVELEDQE